MYPLSLSIKTCKKNEREKKVLFGVLELYISTGRPVGSQVLKETGFDDLSSATIRNYFSRLEEQGYLMQQHSSGGRVPTDLAFQLYAETVCQQQQEEYLHDADLQQLQQAELLQISSYLQQAATVLSTLTGCAVFLSAPRFDSDFIIDIKLVMADQSRCVAIILTQFGFIHTEQLYLENKLHLFAIKRIESYFLFKLKGVPLPAELEEQELAMGQKMYKEILTRYIVFYTHFYQQSIHRAGFSQLLSYSEFTHADALAHGLALFENSEALQYILAQSMKELKPSYWIGRQLEKIVANSGHCATLVMPYRINQTIVGAAGLLGPLRMPYRHLFALLHAFSAVVEQTLTRNIHKFKIQFRQPHQQQFYLTGEHVSLIEQVSSHRADAVETLPNTNIET